MIKKILLIITGYISLGAGILGIFLPVLPTTPFLVLAAICFVKSSKKLYFRLVRNKLVGPYLRNYLRYRAISVKTKFISTISLWIVITISFFSVNLIWLKVFLIVMAVAVTLRIVFFKTLRIEAVN